MRSAETILGIVRDRGSRRLPLEDVYRQLFNPALYLLAYGRISRNAGALTPGATAETADGMTLQKVQHIIDQLRSERYRWTPARRVYIEKKHSTKQRPLGIPTWSDKLLQEVIRLLLEAYYEPQFSPHSHGFRPQRGCHTALSEIHRTWNGTVWFIEGDIAACFDSLDHEVLLSILAERIYDNRFLRLLRNLLKAGYLEAWRYHRTLSGSPQGAVVSPILANIYLDRLDQFVEHTLLPEYTSGKKRNVNPAYGHLAWQVQRARKTKAFATIKPLHRQMRRLPSKDTRDPSYRRLRYIRYADDFLLGFAGPRAEAETIKQRLGVFLREQLRLDLSPTKTLITHGRTGAARFLGYDLVVLQDDQQRTRRSDGIVTRAISGVIGLKVPVAVLRTRCARYMRRGKPYHRTELLDDNVFTIIQGYATDYRGFVNYYRTAYNLHRLNRLKWVMEASLTKTLAAKLRLSVSKVYRRFSARMQTNHGRKRVLQVIVERTDKSPLVATWGDGDLRRQTDVVLNDHPAPIYFRRTELVERLLADTCELCGSHDAIEVHHIRALKDLDRPGRTPKPAWVRTMVERRRKKLVVCHVCHLDIQHGWPRRRANQSQVTGEPDAVKAARPVRRGADGKVPA